MPIYLYAYTQLYIIYVPLPASHKNSNMHTNIPYKSIQCIAGMSLNLDAENSTLDVLCGNLTSTYFLGVQKVLYYVEVLMVETYSKQSFILALVSWTSNHHRVGSTNAWFSSGDILYCNLNQSIETI